MTPSAPVDVRVGLGGGHVVLAIGEAQAWLTPEQARRLMADIGCVVEEREGARYYASKRAATKGGGE